MNVHSSVSLLSPVAEALLVVAALAVVCPPLHSDNALPLTPMQLPLSPHDQGI